MARFRKTRKHEISGLFALVLFGVFAVCVLSVLLTGTDVYNKLVARDRDAYNRRTCAQYVAMKVRQAGTGTSVTLTDFDGVEALTLSEDIDGSIYQTRVYCYDGWLMELFAESGLEFHPENGNKVIEAQALDMDIEDGLLSIRVTDRAGEQTELELYLRGSGAAGEEASE